MKCPYCGGNPVVYDTQFSEYICPHCGAVVDDHPVVDYVSEPRASDEYKHIGSYILNPRFRKMILRQVSVVRATSHKMARLAVNLLHDVCAALSVPETVCLSAERRLLNVIDRMRAELASRPKASHLLRILAALSLYVSSREHSVAVTLEDIAAVLGVSAGKLYSMLWQYRDIVGYKHTDVTELYLARVLKALSKQLTPERLKRVAVLTRELMEKYPVATGRPIYRVLAYALVACKMLRVKVCKQSLARELGVSDYIYSKARRLYRTIKRLRSRVKK
jgi:transcription initiation factor TFIIIB Brf1 subunit/transcription initiation factor TFIIB